jgi:hypothetical protein
MHRDGVLMERFHIVCVASRAVFLRDGVSREMRSEGGETSPKEPSPFLKRQALPATCGSALRLLHRHSSGASIMTVRWLSTGCQPEAYCLPLRFTCQSNALVPHKLFARSILLRSRRRPSPTLESDPLFAPQRAAPRRRPGGGVRRSAWRPTATSTPGGSGRSSRGRCAATTAPS